MNEVVFGSEDEIQTYEEDWRDIDALWEGLRESLRVGIAEEELLGILDVLRKKTARFIGLLRGNFLGRKPAPREEAPGLSAGFFLREARRKIDAATWLIERARLVQSKTDDRNKTSPTQS